ncbi:hypothetical protein GCM10023197_35860 [Gordonia humi]
MVIARGLRDLGDDVRVMPRVQVGSADARACHVEQHLTVSRDGIGDVVDGQLTPAAHNGFHTWQL